MVRKKNIENENIQKDIEIEKSEIKDAETKSVKGESAKEVSLKKREFSDPSMNDIKYVPFYVYELPRVIEAAKGKGRSFADLTRACNEYLNKNSQLTPAFFSRIMNYKIMNPLKEEQIKAIAEVSADKNLAGYRQLMVANGMVRYKTPEQIEEGIKREKEGEERWRKQIEYEKTFKRIIKDELYGRNIIFRDGCRKEHREISENNIYGIDFVDYSSDYSISLLSIDDDTKWESWQFFFNLRGLEVTTLDRREKRNRELENKADDNDKPVPITLGDEIGVLMRSASRVFLMDQLKPDMLNNIRTSFVFSDRKTFDTYYDALKDMKVNSYFSLLLLDVEKGVLIKENKITEDRESPFEMLKDESDVELDAERERKRLACFLKNIIP